jgi:hypothetical protein
MHVTVCWLAVLLHVGMSAHDHDPTPFLWQATRSNDVEGIRDAMAKGARINDKSVGQTRRMLLFRSADPSSRMQGRSDATDDGRTQWQR